MAKPQSSKRRPATTGRLRLHPADKKPLGSCDKLMYTDFKPKRNAKSSRRKKTRK